MCAHLAAEFRERFQVDALAKPRAASRLRQASERVRRVLSANAEGSVALDCLVGDTDVFGSLTRAQLDALSQPLIDEAVRACLDAVRDAGLAPSELDAVELIGGFSRTPAFVTAVRQAFAREPSRTLNAEESVARGAALAAGLRSRTLRMRPLHLREGLLHATSIHWEREGGGTPLGCHELPKAGAVPLQKRVTLRTRSPMRISCRSASSPRQLACRVELTKSADAAARALRVDVLIDENQLPSFRAYEVITPPSSDDDAVDAAAAAQTAVDSTDTKSAYSDEAPTVSNRPASDAASLGQNSSATDETTDSEETNAPAEPMVRPLEMAELYRLGLGEEELLRACELEQAMQRADEAIERASAAKNDLEARIYQARAAVEERLAEFASDDERQGLTAQLEALEDWLYGEGEQQSAQRYEQERDALRTSLARLEERAASHIAVAAGLDLLEAECTKLRSGTKAQAEHVEPILAAVAEAERWAATAREKLRAVPRHDDPSISLTEAHAQLEGLRKAHTGMTARADAVAAATAAARDNTCSVEQGDGEEDTPAVVDEVVHGAEGDVDDTEVGWAP